MELIVHPDAGLLAKAASARLITTLLDAQARRGEASLVLTGGGIGIALLRAVLASPALEAVNWSKVDIWWGDERFVPADSPDRNALQAREALLSHLPVDEKRVFEIGALASEGRADGYTEPEQAAADYAAQLAAHAPDGAVVPAFDVLLLGIGPEGHVASIFPHSSAARATEPVVAVRESPKPPPNRVSLTYPTIQAARQVWVIAAGEEKADAVAAAAAGAGPLDLPAAAATGQDRTLWLIDRAAASRVSS
ncbi:6-phosphogluconolactonase [Frankia sp. AgB1.9]|uniref:6-phosphogluconolactonase n=1 Tax=unclassified Frankia TaxID=2632575 RepID=UPI001933C507|nr:MULTISPECIES: 6-phosphogluconolactonase [unclassified Frankia]MBL7489098.1 6-phosphogluconolactonase [Frankia sp. AgW1.1]MBL7550760.1 6-phosphogluconolactonase [Frankia sp. AgB1.9]MBL7622592.1 6-phosphogluconolactonase [Frankia sp. AgB1.8]